MTEKSPKTSRATSAKSSKSKITRDAKGRIVKGVAQDVNKNGTAGRPTDYRPEYCKQMIEFFSVEPFSTIELTTTDKRTGRKYANEEIQGARLPTLERFAAIVGVHVDTLADWGAKHPEFDRAIRECKQLQKDILVTNGLLGLYNGGFAQFVARNFTDMRDNRNVDITSDGERIKTEPVIISQIAPREDNASVQ